jgi:carotenoid cleavage dioxygenase-like enzyme
LYRCAVVNDAGDDSSRLHIFDAKEIAAVGLCTLNQVDP